MSEYIVSARKYRPDNFENLVGQDNIAKTLKNSILRGQLAHAYLFCGPRGVGKTTTSRIFAKMINCSNPSEDMEPCGQCESCLSFAEGRSYCIHELDAASNNGVDEMKALIDQVRIPPQVGKYSVYIIDEVHMLTTQAFNAFLKTLEEPPAHAIFILATTEKHKILPTILSRCQTYDFNRISVENIVSNLKMIAANESITIDDESLHVIANKADGAMRDALTIFDQTVAFCGTDVRYQDVIRNLNVLDYEYSFSLVDAFLAGDYPTALLKFDEVLSKGFNALHFVGALSSHLRDLIVSKSGGLDALLDLPESLKQRYRQQADKCSVQFIYEALNITTQCEAGYRASINPRLHIEFALMRLSFITRQAPAAQPVPQQAPAATPAPVPSPTAATPTPVAPVAPAQRTVAEQVQPAAPAPAATAEEQQPRRRARAANTGSALSIKSMVDASKTAPEVEKTEVVDVIPSDEDIQNKWVNDLAASYTSQPRLCNALKSAKLEIVEKDDAKYVTFLVQNLAIKTWIEENRLFEIEGVYRKHLGSSKVYLRVGVIPVEETATTIYLSSEKAQDLREKNPEVDKLITQLELDPK
jgi:DNA polymerase-3 subunit gamma/tau